MLKSDGELAQRALPPFPLTSYSHFQFRLSNECYFKRFAMYMIPKVYIFETPVASAFKAVCDIVNTYVDSFSRGIEASRVAQATPENREEVMRILSGE